MNLGILTMKLTDIGTKAHYSKMNKIFESRFGFRVNYSTLTMKKAQSLTKSLTEAITKIRHSPNVHTSEKSANYTELLLVRESLMNWMAERRRINEGEVGQAEALLAAKDIVDTLQDMIEKAGKVQNEQLPALLDTIRDQIGSAEADGFKSSMSQMLTNLVAQLNTSREQADTSVRALTGGAPTPMATGGAPAVGQNGGADIGAELNDMGDGFDATDAAAGGNDAAGRGLR